MKERHKTMDTLLETINSKEISETILLKEKMVAFLKSKEVKEIFSKASEIDSTYTISTSTDTLNISLTTDSELGYPEIGRFWLTIIDKRKILPFNNVLLKAYINVNLFKVGIKKYKSLKLDSETAFDCFKKVIGFEDKTL